MIDWTCRVRQKETSGMFNARGSGWVVVLFTKMGKLEVALVRGGDHTI